MTSTQDCEPKFAALSVVLQPTQTVQATGLTEWLPDLAPTLTWIPLARREGVTKVMAALSQPKFYPEVMQAIYQQLSQSTVVEWQGRTYNFTGVEVDTNELHVLQIPVFPAQALPPTLGRAIHAQFFHWITHADSVLAEKLHQQDNIPITLVMKPGATRQEMYLRIGLLQKELLAPLLWGLNQDLGGEITLTSIPCRLGKYVEIVQANSFAALSRVQPQRIIELQFLSPTSFKQSQFIQPFPLPELVFEGLRRRWNQFAPTQLQFPELQWQGMTCAYDLETRALKMKAEPEIGATGWIRYEFPTEQAAIATVLAHFAGFAGVGRKTAMGMGQTRFMSASK